MLFDKDIGPKLFIRRDFTYITRQTKVSIIMREWSEEEYIKEAERLLWTKEYLKTNLRKERRIQKVFERLKEYFS